MKRTIILVISIMLLTSAVSLTVTAGNETNPEIHDEENDIIGPLISHPLLYKFLQTINVVPIQSFAFMDITTAWFYENETSPDYLFATIKVKNLDYTPLRAIYALRWAYNEKQYGVGCHTHSNGAFTWFFAGRLFGLLDNWAYKNGLIIDLTECTIDTDNNQIIFKIPKTCIGDPNPGDTLTFTNGWTGLRFIWELATYPLGGELAQDPTIPGTDYIIQY